MSEEEGEEKKLGVHTYLGKEMCLLQMPNFISFFVVYYTGANFTLKEKKSWGEGINIEKITENCQYYDPLSTHSSW